MKDYHEFLKTKKHGIESVGFRIEESEINQMLFDWQRKIVQWAIMRGRAAIFEDCGLGKTPQQLEWARIISEHECGKVLILTPLAVAAQTIREGIKFGIKVTHCRESKDVKDGINVTNYERLHKFNANDFVGIVLDESSILKSFDGTTRKQIQEFAKSIKYRLACTATPAPNDLIELTNHAEFLDVMGGKEIVALFFKQDGNTTHEWRLKGHAVDAFWTWMAEWSIAIRKPSDIGYDDGAFKLPSLNMHHVTVDGAIDDGMLFQIEAKTMQERRTARRLSLRPRVDACAELVNSTDGCFLVWCDLNIESEALKTAIPHAVEIRGSDSAEWKEIAAEWFSGKKCVCNMNEFRCKLATCKQNQITKKPITQKNRERRLAESNEYQKNNRDKRNAYMREWTKRNKERLAEKRRATASERSEKRREHYKQCEPLRIKCRAYTKKWKEKNPELRFAQRLKRYGISPTQYRELLAKQGGGCAICGATNSPDVCKTARSSTGRRRLHVDHDHKTGVVRGLLCSSCNIALGKFRDDASIIERAAMYLRSQKRE